MLYVFVNIIALKNLTNIFKNYKIRNNEIHNVLNIVTAL